MVVVRFTEGVNLLEVREERMRLGEEVRVRMIHVLARMAPLVFPALVEIYGEGEHGGFSSSYVVDVYGTEVRYFTDPPPPHFLKCEDVVIDNLGVLGMIVEEVLRKRSLGYVRGDGVTKSLRGRVGKVYVKLAPLRLPNTSVMLHLGRNWLLESVPWWVGKGDDSIDAWRKVSDRLSDAIIVEGDAAKKLYGQVMEPVWPPWHYMIHHWCGARKRPTALEMCRGCYDAGAYKTIVIKNVRGLKICATAPIGRACYVEGKHGVDAYLVELSYSVRQHFTT